MTEEEKINLIVEKMREFEQTESDREIANEVTQFEIGKLYYSPEMEQVIRLFAVNPNSLWKYLCDNPDGDGIEQENGGEAFWIQDIWNVRDIRDEIKEIENED